MPKEITLEEAISVINDYPDVELFIEAKFSQYMSYGEYSDNSVELHNHWHNCKKIIENQQQNKHE